MRVQAKSHWTDRSGGKATVTLHLELDAALSLGSAASRFTPLLASIAAVSNCRCDSFDMRLPKEYVNDTPPEVGSDVWEQGIIIFLSTSGEYTSLNVPSLRQDLYDTAGVFSGIRIFDNLPVLRNLLLPVTNGSLPLVDESGRTISGSVYIAGRNREE
jgi:hypothetical protein